MTPRSVPQFPSLPTEIIRAITHHCGGLFPGRHGPGLSAQSHQESGGSDVGMAKILPLDVRVLGCQAPEGEKEKGK